MITPIFKAAIKHALVASAIQILFSFYDIVIYNVPLFVGVLIDLLDLYILWGIIMFCKSMIVLSETYNLEPFIKKWNTAKQLFLWLNLIPLGILQVIILVYLLSNIAVGQWHMESVFGVTLSLILTTTILLIPLIYALVILYQMRKFKRFY
ncbi:hypothetical protein [uncultured Psychroserpens sp.]|uniref:hypothetical protein n=1 Tax=uncultured Psychroserpens sp. TaxID=255436 RepID=UPI002628DA18|nr:hypothetical protein [uncultured Psychroserpens sp.]